MSGTNGIIAGIGDFGISQLVDEAVDAKELAQQYAEDANEALESLAGADFEGEYNITTNTPVLTAIPSPSLNNGKYYIINGSGVIGFSGANFSSGQQMSTGDRLIKKGGQWTYLPLDLTAFYPAISQKYFVDTKPTVIAAGSVLSNPNSLTCHIAPAGTYTLPSGNVTLTGNINFFFWDFASGWTWQSFSVKVARNDINDESIYIEKLNPSIFESITRRSYLLNQSASFYYGEKEAIKVISHIEVEYQSPSAKADVWCIKSFSKGIIDGTYDNFLSIRNITKDAQVQRSLTISELSSGYAEFDISSISGYTQCFFRIWFDFTKTSVQNNWLVSSGSPIWNIKFVPCVLNPNNRIDGIEAINSVQNSRLGKLDTQNDIDNLVRQNINVIQKIELQNKIGAISAANGSIITGVPVFYEEADVTNSNYILVKTALFGTNNYGYAFYDGNNVCILSKKTTASDYEIIRVPYNATTFRVTYSILNQGFVAIVKFSQYVDIDKNNIFGQPKKIDGNVIVNKTFNTFYKCIVDNTSPNKLYSFELKSDTQIGIVGKIDILSATAYGSDNGWAVLDEDGIIEQSGKFTGAKLSIYTTKKSKTFLLSSQSIPIVYLYERTYNSIEMQSSGINIPINAEEGYICNSTTGAKVTRSAIASYSEFIVYGYKKIEFIGNQWGNNDGGYAFVDVNGAVISGTPAYTTNATYIVDVPTNAYKMRICWLNNTTAQKVTGYGFVTSAEYNSSYKNNNGRISVLETNLYKNRIGFRDGFYQSFASYINSYNLGKQLEVNLFNYRINPLDKFTGGAKILIENGYIYSIVMVNQSAYNETSSEPIFLRLYKISLSDWSCISVDITKIGQTDIFSDGTSYTYDYSTYDPIIELIGGKINIMYSARISGVFSLCRKVFNASDLSIVSTDFCKFINNNTNYTFNTTNIKSQFINGKEIISNFDSHICSYAGHSLYNGYYYIGIASSYNKSWGGVFKTQNFKDFELVYEIPRDIPTKFEISVNVNSIGIAHIAIRTTDEIGADNVLYILKYRLIDNVLLEKLVVEDCHTMPLFFRDTKLYLFVGGRYSRNYYKLIEVNENNLRESQIILDTNNHNIANMSLAKNSDGWIYLSREDGYITRFIIQEKTNSEVDTILEKIMSL